MFVLVARFKRSNRRRWEWESEREKTKKKIVCGGYVVCHTIFIAPATSNYLSILHILKLFSTAIEPICTRPNNTSQPAQLLFTYVHMPRCADTVDGGHGDSDGCAQKTVLNVCFDYFSSFVSNRGLSTNRARHYLTFVSFGTHINTQRMIKW